MQINFWIGDFVILPHFCGHRWDISKAAIKRPVYRPVLYRVASIILQTALLLLISSIWNTLLLVANLKVKITQLHRHRPGTEFLLECFDRSTPSKKVPLGSTHAPVRLIDNFVVDDMIAVKHPKQPADFAIGKVMHVHYDSDELPIRY